VTGYTLQLPIKLPSPGDFGGALPQGVDGTGGGQKDNTDLVFIVGLWNYCEGSNQGHTYSIQNCSASHSNFWFDPVEALGLSVTEADKLFPDRIQAALQTSRKVSQWMVTAYSCSLVAHLIVLLAGFFSFFTGLGGAASTICSAVSHPMSGLDNDLTSRRFLRFLSAQRP
jgi:hypothetical protein